MSLDTSSTLESTRGNEAICLSLAIGIHALALIWNPIVMSSDWHPAHDFVQVDVVDQAPAVPGEADNTPKAKPSLIDTLKDMLIRPKPEEIAHVAPEPVVPRVAAPVHQALQERIMPRPIANAFQPQSQSEDLAMANAPNQINAANRNLPNVPIGGPTLKVKSFGGIRAPDLPFQVGGGESISGGQNVIPVAIGNNSAKRALDYGGPSLSDSKTHHTGISPSLSGAAELNTIGAGSASTIQLSGSGGTGNAPTGAASGSSIHDRSGSGSGGGLHSRSMFGGSGTALARIDSMPSEAQALDTELSSPSKASAQAAVKKGRGFDLAGPLNNRAIVHKSIPQYPAWAEEQGIIGSVRLYFTVTPEGMVRTNIRVTKTTGYPQLDQLGIDALKQWQFAPSPSDDEGKGEWGIITFNFSLSS